MLHGSLNPEDVHRKLAESEEFKERFFSFFEDIIQHDLPMDMPYDANMNLKAETSPIIPGPDAMEEELEHFMRIFEQDVKSCRERLQRHTHKAVCNKYDHDTCRFQFPHEFVSESYFDPEMKAVVLACQDQMVNYYNEWVLVFCRFNHDLCCILSSKSCKAAMFYITDYIMKMTVKTYKMLSLMSMAVMKAHVTMPEGDPHMSVRNMIHKCLTQYGKQQQVHAQQAAGVLRGQQEMFSSHKTVPMLSGAMMQYVKAHWPWKTDTDDPDDIVEDPYITMRLNGRGELSRQCQFTEYLHQSLDLAHISFYDFVRRFRVERRESLKEESLSMFTTGDFITKLPRYSFVREFKLYSSHHIVEHTSESEAVHFTKTIPRIIGHKLPWANDPCYAAFMLGHFKPFHSDIPLVDVGLDIAETFREYIFSVLGQRCMKNWEAMHECEDERDVERLRKRSQMFKNSQLLTNAHNGQSIDDLVELPDFSLATVKRDARAQFQLMKLAESNWFVPVGVANQSEVHLLLKDLVITSLMRDRWNKQVKQLEGAIAASRVNAAGKEQVAPPAKEMTSTFDSMDTTNDPSSGEGEDPGVKHTIGSEKHEKLSTADLLQCTVDKFKLNPEQEIAFRIMADVFLKRLEVGDVEDDGGPELFPLRMFLMGSGGTGKTYVIKALVDVMESFGYAHAVRFIAPTGSAAAINDGLTIHTAFKIKICDKVSKHNSRSMEGKETYEATLSQSMRQHLR
ncbi:uncharacterized protein ARMOST_20945 [Armillaria ostoyae]|uniref:ATP-dependent DNA helicase n=1 Tax=Armillaria ostoyae TaxID=47428 RepID=A0A284S8Q5_ARMOS|nr:uncharacterized protein ARMOST_20945 [Armillaria ostoyae]